MTIEEALRKIAETEPTGVEESGWKYCVYCHGEEERVDGSYVFLHQDCPWEYLKQNVEEDKRIEERIRIEYPSAYYLEFWKKQKGESS